jgi:hypothetical protein
MEWEFESPPRHHLERFPMENPCENCLKLPICKSIIVLDHDDPATLFIELCHRCEDFAEYSWQYPKINTVKMIKEL